MRLTDAGARDFVFNEGNGVLIGGREAKGQNLVYNSAK